MKKCNSWKRTYFKVPKLTDLLLRRDEGDTRPEDVLSDDWFIDSKKEGAFNV